MKNKIKQLFSSYQHHDISTHQWVPGNDGKLVLVRREVKQ